MSGKDWRYDLIKPMVGDGKIKSFNDIFKYIPKTVVATDLGKKVDRFNALMNKVEGFTIDELFKIARNCKLEESKILELTLNEYQLQKAKIMNQ